MVASPALALPTCGPGVSGGCTYAQQKATWDEFAGYFGTDGFLQRSWNKVWHASGYSYVVYYQRNDGYNHGVAQSSGNPTVYNASSSGQSKSWCYNYVNDYTETQTTCQTTKP